MNAADIAIYALTLPGHVALWITAVNRIQAEALPRWFLELVSWPMRFMSVLGPLGFMLWAGSHHFVLTPRLFNAFFGWAWSGYVALCIAIALVLIPRWLIWALKHQRSQVTDHLSSVRHNLSATAAGHHPRLKARLLARLPGNQIYQLDVAEKSLALRHLPAALDGLTIAHLSDLHFTGDVSERYFAEVVRLTNDMDSDLIVISGDVVDKRRCLDWIPRTLAGLRARQGVFYVLGNHDTRLDYREVHREMQSAGFVPLGGRWESLSIRDHAVLLAGNELPWIRPAADPGLHPANERLAPGESRPLRICVAHSPDQFGWARRHGFDLLLAGHTHGGQIRFPLVGAIVSPSRYGPRYAAGTYHESPTIMHVSRGISGDTPLRWNCAPELARLTLRARIEPELCVAYNKFCGIF